MPAPQNFKNHARIDPPYHYIIAPIILANLVHAAYITVNDWPLHSHSNLWWIVVSIALVLMVLKLRTYPLTVQNRVIRLEERIRYGALLPTTELSKSNQLTLPQIIALRFASDAELPGLIDRAIAEELTPKQIKQSIVTWRPDYDRV